MKRIHSALTMGFFFLALCVLPAYADIVVLDGEKSKLSFYGFVKLDMGYQDGGVNGLTIARYAVPGVKNLFLNAANSRFGFKFSGAPTGCGWKIAGTLEWDLLDTTTPTQMKIRTRQAFFSLAKGNSTFVLGQAWDLFSPLGPTTLNINGYLWQVGNVGFRHAQVRYARSSPRLDLSFSLNDPASVNGWKAAMPLLQARVGVKLAGQGKIQLGVSGAYGLEKNESTGVDPVVAENVNVLGLCFDWNVPFGKGLTLKGEYTLGENLAYFMSRGAVFWNGAAGRFEAKKSSSFWTQLLYAKKSWSFWTGYSFENLTRQSQLAAGEIQDASCILAGAQYALGGGAAIGVEYSHFRSQYASAVKAGTNQVLLSAVYNF